MDHEPRSVERDGVPIGLLHRDGAGPPVVLVPGAMADAASWWPVASALGLPSAVTVVNRRGRAPSGPQGDGYGVRTEIDDLHAVLDAVGPGAHLVGWSIGGLFAIETALERSDIGSLTLYDPVSAPAAPELVEPIRRAVEGGDPGRAVEIVNVDFSGFSPEYVAELRRSPAWPVLCELVRPAVAELAAVNAYDARLDEYRDITIPFTMIVGELSASHPVYGTSFDRFTAAAPQARADVLRGQGHLAHVEAPDVLGTTLGAIIRRHG